MAAAADPTAHAAGSDGEDADGAGYPDVPPIHNPVQDRLDSYSRAIPVRPRSGGESIYESEDRRRRRRSDDTGPIWPSS